MKRFIASVALLIVGNISQAETEVIACDPETLKCLIRVDCIQEGSEEICTVEVAEIYWIPKNEGGIEREVVACTPEGDECLVPVDCTPEGECQYEVEGI